MKCLVFKIVSRWNGESIKTLALLQELVRNVGFRPVPLRESEIDQLHLKYRMLQFWGFEKFIVRNELNRSMLACRQT